MADTQYCTIITMPDRRQLLVRVTINGETGEPQYTVDARNESTDRWVPMAYRWAWDWEARTEQL